MQARVVGQAINQSKPHPLQRCARDRMDRTQQPNRAHLERPLAREVLASLLGQARRNFRRRAIPVGQVFRWGHLGHIDLVIEPRFRFLEGRRESEDLLAVLDRDHTTR